MSARPSLPAAAPALPAAAPPLSAAAPDDGFRELRAPDPGADEPLPPEWTPSHVGLRLVDAMRTLDRLPRPKGPRGCGNHWPAHRVEWADHMAQAELPELERRARAARRNELSLRPSGLDIDRMDRALDWLRDLRAHDADLALVATLSAMRQAKGRSLRGLCRERGWTPQVFYKRRGLAHAHLALHLAARRVPVF